MNFKQKGKESSHQYCLVFFALSRVKRWNIQKLNSTSCKTKIREIMHYHEPTILKANQLNYQVKMHE